LGGSQSFDIAKLYSSSNQAQTVKVAGGFRKVPHSY